MPSPEPPHPELSSTVERSRLEAQRRSDLVAERVRTEPASLCVLTGDRPTGPLHLGHLFGSLGNRVRLQQAGVPTMIIIADYQVITDRAGTDRIAEHVRDIVCDQLAVGIDPAKSTMFTHSAIPELNQLLLPFLSLISIAELQRNPTVKAEAAAAGISAISGLLLTYPVHQAADILGVGGTVVPVGLDQLPHLEVTRLLVRRFTEAYGPCFTAPEALLSEAPVVLGIDGTKMSKSRGNAIELRHTADETAALIRRARTDSDRRITYDPQRRPEVSNLVLITSLCTGEEPRAIAERIGDGGAGALKQLTIAAVNEHLAPIRARRRELAAVGDDVLQVVRDGNVVARARATATLDRVTEAMGMIY
ncbi:tryptophan--tRNA ligase [Microlunatus sp. Y2014]|uniref:tryptophan--tRNA ligase n=1 Tax=Microlunatus sp. Y2014 TaxID=3418488 RepID=UPI003DA6CEF5